MINILVSGGFKDGDPEKSPKTEGFARLLGKEVIKQGHVLLSACLFSFDRVVAEGAKEELEEQEQGEDIENRIIGYVLARQESSHKIGNIRPSQLYDWELGTSKFRIPEPIEKADVVVLVEGYIGTQRAANWARIAQKPLLPVPRFSKAAQEIYYDVLDSFDQEYPGHLTKDEFENLSQIVGEPSVLAQRVINLAELALTSRSVFVIMSFSDDPSLEDAYESFKDVCSAFKPPYDCRRVDEESDVPRILPEILTRISRCAFTIVDLSEEKANVYYELGYAEALEKPLIITAKDEMKGKLPFDVQDIPVIFWKNQKGMKNDLRKKIESIAKKQGRIVPPK